MDKILSALAIGVSSGLVYGLLALGIVLIYKGSRVLNFAHPYFGLLCAFNCWWFTSEGVLFGVPLVPFGRDTKPRFAVAVVYSLLLVALNGYAVGNSIFKRLRSAPRLVLLVATIALAQGSLGTVALLFNRNEDQITAAGLRRLPTLLEWNFTIGTRVVTAADVQVLLLVPTLCVAAALFFKYTKFGVAIRAAAENGEAARLLGISVDKVSAFTWVVGSLLAGIAGILITEARGSLDVATLSTGFLVRGLAAGLVGGLTSLPGAIVGGLLVGVSESLLKLWTDDQSGVPETLLFLAIIAVLLFRPGGLFGQREETEDKVAFVPAIKELPKRLRDTAAAKGLRFVPVVLLLFVMVISLVTGAKTNTVLTETAVFAMVAVSLTVLMGYTGQISLGHFGLVGVGAFTLANLFTRLHVPYLLSLPITFFVGMLVALLIGLPALRIRGLYLAVATLAFNLAAEFWIFQSNLVGGTTAGIQVDPPTLGPFDLDSTTRRPIFFFTLIFLGFSMWLARNLARSRTGRGFFALRENEKAAATLGVGLTQYKLLAFAVSGGIAALAGGLFVTSLQIAESTTWTTATSLVLISVVMIGGLGSVSGAVYGAFFVKGLPLLLNFKNPWIVPIGTGLLLIIVIVRLPGGVAGLVQSVRERLIIGLSNLTSPPSTPAPTPTAPPATGR